MQITFIRHLPTEWNKEQRLQGRRDIALAAVTEGSRQGIAHNQQQLKALSPFDMVLTSTLKRTQQTAHLYGYSFETEPLLDELDFGPFEGLPKEKLYEEYGEQWFEQPRALILGESLINLEERIISFLEKYRDLNNLLVFGHGSWIRAVISYFQYGHINHMNKMTVENNECITLTFHS
ncbi:histidine phosphatase family protein [Pseudobacillus wudalianchiensis]|uniref:Phosphoglycerate mutase n=1 Tax=Pseudobacillus wudalianchiensis TaxID=1743143 RepID=A0A1B9AZB0_9BACI|nr:histidine phosphatase family protein [Bacillus wudalianchiensis]OCA89078.1 phosphoglycerate mutase [Bacillus wudalianchiensis]